MDFALSAEAEDVCARAWDFMREHVFPAEPVRIVDGPDAVHIRGVAKEEPARERPYRG